MKHVYKPGASVKIIWSFDDKHIGSEVKIIKRYNEGYKIEGVYKYYITRPTASAAHSTYYSHKYLELI